MMKSLLMGLASLALATSAEAETWTCSPNGTPRSVLMRFTISPPDVIFRDERLHIVHNDEYGLLAAGSATMTKDMLSADKVWVYTA
jgi:hypothetical protein